MKYKKKFKINMADTLRFVVMLSPDLIALEANSNAKTQFLTVPGSLSVDELIGKACESWLIEPEMHSHYCLIFDDASRKYLTEGKTRRKNIYTTLWPIFHPFSFRIKKWKIGRLVQRVQSKPIKQHFSCCMWFLNHLFI